MASLFRFLRRIAVAVAATVTKGIREVVLKDKEAGVRLKSEYKEIDIENLKI